jgi:hypothetical protein
VSATADRISAARAVPQRRSSLSSRHRRHCQGPSAPRPNLGGIAPLPDRPSNRLRPAAMMLVASGKVLPSIALSTACRSSSGSQRRSRVDLWHQNANHWHVVTRPGWDAQVEMTRLPFRPPSAAGKHTAPGSPPGGRHLLSCFCATVAQLPHNEYLIAPHDESRPCLPRNSSC